jgi:glycyl-tRNA synthetase
MPEVVKTEPQKGGVGRDSLEEITKRRGFFWPAFEIYGGCSGFYDYGPLGSLLKLKIENVIRKSYVIEEGCISVECPTLTIEQPWVASGHVKSFADFVVECEKCGEPYRADHLISEKTGKDIDGIGAKELDAMVKSEGVKCRKCGGHLGPAYSYNMMFPTSIGPGKNKVQGYLRPETAQTTYMPFRRLFDIGRKKLPMGVIQIGKSFRNEINPRQGLVRLREFSQAEVQFFIEPSMKQKHLKFDSVKDMRIFTLTKHHQAGTRHGEIMTFGDIVKNGFACEWIAYFLGKSVNIFRQMGMPMEKLRLRQHMDNERSFYSNDTWDVEFVSETCGRIELVGIADRTDYDLSRHQEVSKQDMSVMIEGRSEKFVPHVIEVAYGIDRPVFCSIEACFRRDKERTYFSFPPEIAPYSVAVFPLIRKDERLPALAEKIVKTLMERGLFVLYDEGFIGKLYYRQDEAGTPYCVTVDFDSLKDDDVTLRHRDTQEQRRVPVAELPQVLNGLMNGKVDFGKVGKKVAVQPKAGKNEKT